MPKTSLWFRGTNEEMTAKVQRLRDLAQSLGYTIIASKNAGEGNIAALLEGIDAGEVIIFKVPPEYYGWLAGYLEKTIGILREREDTSAPIIASALTHVEQAVEDAWLRREGEDGREP